MPVLFFSEGRVSEGNPSDNQPLFCRGAARVTISSEPKIRKLEIVDVFKISKEVVEISDCPALACIRVCVDTIRLVLKNLPSLIDIEINYGNRVSFLEMEGCRPKKLEACRRDLSKIKFGEGCSIPVVDLRTNSLNEIDLSFLKNLKELRLDGNNISRLDLHNMIHLKILNVSKCMIENIDVSDLISLESFNVYSNQLKTLKVADLTRLSDLDASNNEIDTFSLDNTPSLKILNLSNNKLENFIYWSHQETFKDLDLRNNDLQYLVLSFKVAEDIRLGHVKLLYAPYLLTSRVTAELVPGDAITSNIFPLLSCGWKGDPRFGFPKIPGHLGTLPVRWLTF